MSDNNKPRVRFKGNSLTADSLTNLVTNMGTRLDKRNHNQWAPNQLAVYNWQILDTIYDNSSTAPIIIETKPRFKTQRWRTFKHDNPEILERFKLRDNDLNVRALFNQTDSQARLHGNSYILIAVDDGQNDISKPIKHESIKPGSLKLVNLGRDQIQPQSHNNILDPFNPLFLQPEFYHVSNSKNGTKIHHSRLIRFNGANVSNQRYQMNNYHNNSVLQRIHDDLMHYDAAKATLSTLLEQCSVDVIHVQNLMNNLSNSEYEDRMLNRFTLAKLMQGNNNMMLLDTNEQFSVNSRDLGSASNAVSQFLSCLAAASEHPEAILLKTSPGGLNQSDRDDINLFLTQCELEQSNDYRSKLAIIDKLIMCDLGLPDENIEYDFVKLTIENSLEQSQEANTRAQTDSILLETGVINVAHIAERIGAEYSLSPEYIKLLQQLSGEDNDPVE